MKDRDAMDDRTRWTKGMVKMAAGVANEKCVMVRLQTDGNILILPLPDSYKEDSEKWQQETDGLKPG